MDIRILDLSAGGCLIDSLHDVLPGRRITLDIHLPDEGWITLKAETLYSRSDYGFGVKFVEVPDNVRGHLDRQIDRLVDDADKVGVHRL
jgi:hypothetical protein